MALAALLFAAAASAEAPRPAGIDALGPLSEACGFDAADFARRLVAGEEIIDLQTLLSLAGALAADVRRELSGFAAGLAIPVLAALALKIAFAGRGRVMSAPLLVCRLCCAVTLIGRYMNARDTAEAMMKQLSGTVELMAPTLSAALALGGSTLGSAVTTPLAALCADIIEHLLCGWGLPLCSAAAAVAAAGNLSPQFSLTRLFELLRLLLKWLLRISVLSLGAALGARGLTASAADSALMGAAKGAIEGVLPIIGGELSGSAGALAASARAVRGAIGVAGVAALLKLCAAPMLKVTAVMLALKAAAAMMEPLGDAGLSNAVAGFAELAEMLLSLCAACALVAALLAGGVFALAGGILSWG